jgi:GNAT superfamily N-acetyltransferase
MDAIQVAELVEFGEAEAYADMFAAAPVEWNLRVERLDSALVLVAPFIDTLLFNRVLGLGVNEPASEIHLMEAVALYRQVDVRRFGIQLSPIAQPPSLPDWLFARGLQRADNWAKVYRAAAEPIERHTELRVEAIGRKSAADFARVACIAFEMPSTLQPLLENLVDRAGWHVYLAFDGDQPVACGALFVRGEVGWLGVAGTLPAYRRRGGQGSIMARRIRDAARLGCRWVVTETGEDLPGRPNPSFHNMLRTGFTLAYQRPNYLPEK